jgi:hypothetical protein
MTLKVLATRDDGARLIGDDDLSHALLESDDGSIITTIDAAAARGYWNWASEPASVQLPAKTEAAIRRASAEFTAS